MAIYTCARCSRPRSDDDHGFHTTRRDGGSVDRCICDECFPDELADASELAAVDGKSLDDHFVCPECLAVLPDARLVQYHHQDDFVIDSRSTEGQVCLGCQTALFNRLKKNGTYVTWAAEYATGRELVSFPE